MDALFLFIFSSRISGQEFGYAEVAWAAKK